MDDIYWMKNKDTINILIVEDNAADARLLQLMLENHAHLKASVSISGSIDSASSDAPDVILMDVGEYSRPKFRLLRQLAATSDAYIIAISGLDEKKLALEAIQAGAQDFLVKGRFNSDDLLTKIELALVKHTRAQNLRWAQKLNKLMAWSYQWESKEFHWIDSHPLSEELATFLSKEIRLAIQDALAGKKWDSEILYSLSGKDDVLKERKYFHLTIEKFSTEHPPSEIRGIVQDITERKKADELLEETHQKYIDIFANSSDGIYLSTTLGLPQECNKSGLEIFGITAEELLNTNIHHFFSNDSIQKILVDIGYKRPVKNKEIEVIRKDGSVRNCLLSVVYFSDESDMYTGILRDITERKMAEKIKRTRVLEMESNQLKEQFIAAISHEMRTPMNAIIGLSNLLLDTNLNQEQRDYLKSIHYSSEQLLGILNDILDISSLKNGKIVFENKNFDIHNLLQSTVHNLSYKVVNKNVKLDLYIDPNLPRILKGDKLRINQILYNLAGNAVKFTDEGQVKVSCNLVGQSGDTVLVKFAISDTGIGIPKEKQDAIFESFTRIKHKTRIFEGTGLGLAISKNLIEQQGGKIWVTSKPNEGSTFYFDLVLELGETEVEKNKEVPQQGIVIVNPKKIMIVEDNKMNQLVAKKLLAKRWPELEIVIANNGQEAVNLIDQDFDVILMDLYMPVMDGYEATAAIRNHPKPNIKNLPILAMTADAQIQEGDKHKEYQLNGFIVKPFDPGILYEKILSQLNQSHAEA